MNNFLKAITKNVSDFISHESVEQDISMICGELTEQAFKDLQPMIKGMVEKQVSSMVKLTHQDESDMVSKISKKKSLLEEEIDTIDREICYHMVKKDINEEEITRMTLALDDKKSDLILINKVLSILE